MWYSASRRRQLIETLGVLRRPQTRADRYSARPRGEGGLLPSVFRLWTSKACRGAKRSRGPCALQLDTQLIRTVSVPGSGYEVGIFPATARPPTTFSQLGEGVVISLRGPGIYLADSGPNPTSVDVLRTDGLLLSAYVADGVNRGVMLVPDGVANVALGGFRLTDPSTAARSLPIPSTSATVHDNVALLQLTGLTEKNLQVNPSDLGQFFYQGSGRGCHMGFAIYALPAAAQMSWSDFDGKTVNHATIRLTFYVSTDHPASGTTTRNPACAQAQR